MGATIRRLAALALTTGGVACGDGSTDPRPRCSGPATLAVSEGTTPQITWTPSCGVELLVVNESLEPSGGLGFVDRWVIRAGGRLIESPVRYGQAPEGATVVVGAQQLAAGRSYGVVVLGEDYQVLSRTTFTP